MNADDVKAFDIDAYKQEQYDILADSIRKCLDMDYIYSVMRRGK